MKRKTKYLGENCKIMTELLFETDAFERMCIKAADILKQSGLNPVLISPQGKRSSHLTVANSEVKRARDLFQTVRLKAQLREVILVKIRNKPGALVQVLKKIANGGINLKYAVLIPLDSTISYAIFETDDNPAALGILTNPTPTR